jgi:hypothetical protein
MHSSLTTATEWAEREFSSAQLNDKRRTKRLVKTAAFLAERPSGLIPDAMKDLKDIKGAYDFFSHPEVTYEKIIRPHTDQTQAESAQPGEYFLLEDTTDLDFTSHKAAEDLGRIGDDGGRGLFLHTTLALRVLRWIDNEPDVDIIGIWAQRCWARTEPTHHGNETRAEMLRRPRESQRWAQSMTDSNGPPPNCRWTHIADRESDIYEVFERCTQKGADFIVRASRKRALAEEDQTIFQAAAEAPVLGHYELHLRARPSQAARTAKLEVRATRVAIRGPWRPGGRLQPIELNVVEAKETNAQPGKKPIHWLILTSWPVDNFIDARKAIAAYATRWLIEEYHKALKSGTEVEKSQLATAQRLKALLGILAIVAVRLLRLKILVDIKPDQPIQWEDSTQSVRNVLEARVGRPKQGWTNRTLLISIAKCGGFLGRKSDGNPGWITLWRGVKELMFMAQGYEIARPTRK